jgi:hypothetical protein
MNRIDELERAPPSSGKALVRAPDLLQDYAYGRALPWRHVSRREARSVRVSEEHEGGQHADKRSGGSFPERAGAVAVAEHASRA